MGLRANLFTHVGMIIFCYALVVLLLPTYIINKDLDEEDRRIQTMIMDKEHRIESAQKILLGDVFERIRDNINSFLFIIYDTPLLQEQLSFPKQSLEINQTKKEILSTWESLIRIASYDPEIGFLQLDSIDGVWAAVLKPADAYLYEVTSSPINDQLMAIHVHRSKEGKIDDEHYLGIKLAANLSTDVDHEHYALIPWGVAKSYLESIEKKIVVFEEHFKKATHLGVAQVFIDPENKIASAKDWVIKNDLIQVLIPLVVSNYVDYMEKKWIPEGIARFAIGELEKGEALMTTEVMSVKSLVDAQTYYASNLPSAGSPSLAKGNLYITGKSYRHIYIANTLKTENFYLTLGMPIDPLAQQLAIWTNKDIVIRINDQLWFGYGEAGVSHKDNFFSQIHVISDRNQKQGTLEINGRVYLYSNLANIEDGNISFYELSRIDGGASTAKFIVTVAKHSAWKISFQLFILSLILIAIIFFIVSRLLLVNTLRPIIKLAAATEFVVAGRYADVELPKMGKRKDEIAILTAAFADMVISLQEKAKIRGVLDKVVSKEVADEILKSNIHLGGEDRNVSILFGDIRGFTAMTEKYSPQRTIGMLNEAMTKVTHVIEAESGVVDKYVGDEVMAIFGAPVKHEDHALNAVSAGVLMMQAIKRWNDERIKRGEIPIEMGIGINSGVVVAGNMGAEDRLNYTVLGSNVNLASRICSYAEPNQLIITEQTYLQPKVKESFITQPLGAAILKGVSEPVKIYLVLDFNWHKDL